MTTQGEFVFDAHQPPAGYVRWIAARKVAAEELARRLNLPLGHEVEVWLYGGVRLRGRLQLREEFLLVEEDRMRHLELVVGNVNFTCREVESCVRMD